MKEVKWLFGSTIGCLGLIVLQIIVVILIIGLGSSIKYVLNLIF